MTRRTAMTVLSFVVLATAWFVYTHRSYFGELQRVFSYTRGPVPVSNASPSGERLGEYYIHYELQTEVTPADEEVISKPWVPPVALGRTDHPVAVAQNGLRNYDRWTATGDGRFLEHARAASDHLLGLQNADGSWDYNFAFRDLEAGWRSAMAQGEAISLLLRVSQDQPDDRYLAAARRSYECMLRPVSARGTLGSFPDGDPILEEYAGSEVDSAVLNGAIFALFGVRDLMLVTGDAEVGRTWTSLSDALAGHLDGYDRGEWTVYDLDPMGHPAGKYHRIHIAQARVMYELTGDSRWRTAAERWERYRQERAQWSGIRIWWQDLKDRFHVVLTRRNF
ncbi:MAG: hypothetical protein IBX63_05275 [Coriobacteriia bacterium]|nr:hypothetical protein [Coriobacteriia bacterium]